jgi:hypothetical protein
VFARVAENRPGSIPSPSLFSTPVHELRPRGTGRTLCQTKG